jgi:hypothetical protein
VPYIVGTLGLIAWGYVAHGSFNEQRLDMRWHGRRTQPNSQRSSLRLGPLPIRPNAAALFKVDDHGVESSREVEISTEGRNVVVWGAGPYWLKLLFLVPLRR